MGRLFDPEALERLAAVVHGAPAPPLLRLRLGASSSGFTARLADAASEVSEGTGGIVALRTERGPSLESVLTVEVGGRRAIHYRAVPEGPEAAPFLETVLELAAVQPTPGRHVERPTAIEVFIAPTCPNCPQAVRAATALAATDPLLTVTVVDVDEHGARAEEMRVRSVPTTVVDGGLTVVGVMAADELARRIAAAHGLGGPRAVLASQLEAGRFDAASRLLADAEGRRAFIELWLASTLESRIGLLLTAEEALGRDAGSLDALVAGLLPGLQTVDVALRGDTVDLLARIGHPAARRDLELLTRDPVADIAEAAREAVAALRVDEAVVPQEGDDAET